MKALLILISIGFLAVQLKAQKDNSVEFFNELSLEEKKRLVIQALVLDTIKFSKEDIRLASS